MDDATRYRLTTWRKRLEQRGWMSLRRARPPRDRLIEYHVIWQGRMLSGRAKLMEFDRDARWEPGSPIYLLERGVDVFEAVWRVANDQGGRHGQVSRQLPLQ